MHYVENYQFGILYRAFCQIVTGYGTQSLGLELCLLAASTYNKNFMGGNCCGGAYCSARQASGCPRALAEGSHAQIWRSDNLQP